MRALIFDVDGTLADTEEVHRESFNQAFAHFGLEWSWTRPLYRKLLQVTGGKERIRAYIDQLTLGAARRDAMLSLVGDLHAEKTRCYGRAVAEGRVALRPGVARLVQEARAAGWHLAIATTSTAANVDALLQATLGERGLDWFSVIACGDLVRRKKPAPDIFKLVLDTLGMEPADAIALEDSANGLRAARAAGLWTVITPTYWTGDEDFADAQLVLPHLGDPGCAIAGEPGARLRQAPWLTMRELIERTAPPKPDHAVARLYQGMW